MLEEEGGERGRQEAEEPSFAALKMKAWISLVIFSSLEMRTPRDETEASGLGGGTLATLIREAKVPQSPRTILRACSIFGMRSGGTSISQEESSSSTES